MPMSNLNIHLYTFCYNEEFLAPYFLRHYLPIASKIIVFDNHSTDRSAEILGANPNVFIKKYDSNNEFRDDLKLAIANTVWKKSKGHADFVIICDFDEFLYHPNIAKALLQAKKESYSVIRCRGYDMISDRPPEKQGQIYHEIKEGARNPEWDKMMLFDPNQITDINYNPGAHWALPEGNVKILKHGHEFKLLHFRYLGLDHILQKHKERAVRLSEVNLKHKWGRHYLYDDEKQREIFDEAFERREIVI